MAKVVRLKGPEQREWNSNISILVDEEGTIIRPITAKESMTMFQVGRHVAKTREAYSHKTPEEDSTVEARLEALPGGGVMVRFYIDGLVVVGGREAMKARILQEHGPCILYRTNGKFLCAVRDPNQRLVTASEANRTTPAPDVCICKDWEGRQKGKHHPICQHNDRAPLEERGSFGASQSPTASAVVLASNPTVKATPTHKPLLAVGTKVPGLGRSVKETATVVAPSKTVKPTVNIPGVTPPSPEACVCKSWALPDGVELDRNRHHHPMCEWKDKWQPPPEEPKAEEPKTEELKVEEATLPDTEAPPPKMYIINTDTGEAMREAEPEEIEQAAKNDGMVIIDGVPYGVVEEQALEDVPEEEQRPEDS